MADKVIKAYEKRTLPDGTIQEGKIVQKANGDKVFVVGSTTPPPKKAAAPAAKPAAAAPVKTGQYRDTDGSIKTYNTPAAGSTPVKQTTAYKDTAAYKNLSDEQKSFVDLAYGTIATGGEEDARKLSNAIQQATAIADPYYKSQLNLALGTIQTKVADLTGNDELKRNALKLTRDRLQEDLVKNKDYLTLEQQADMATAVRGFNQDLLTIADSAAEKGLTFATGAQSRAEAEARRTATYQDVVTSSNRDFNYKIKELETQAARGDQDAQAQLDAINANEKTSLQSIGQQAEALVGSKNTNVDGYTPVGGVTGSIDQNKQQDIIKDVGGFMDLQKGFV